MLYWSCFFNLLPEKKEKVSWCSSCQCFPLRKGQLCAPAGTGQFRPIYFSWSQWEFSHCWWESLWLILTAEIPSALEITIQSAVFLSLLSPKLLGVGGDLTGVFWEVLLQGSFGESRGRLLEETAQDITTSLLPKSESPVQTAWAALRWTQNLQSPGLGLWMLWGSLLHRKLPPPPS